MRAGADGRPELAVARQSSPELAVLAEFALPLPSFFLTSIAGTFGFEGGSAGCLGGCLPAAAAPESADVALPLPSSFLTSFLTSLAAILGFGARDGGCLGSSLPVAIAPALGEDALPLPSVLSTSGIFGFGTGNGICLPAATRSSSRGTSIAKRPGWRMRPAMRPASSPAPQ